MKIQPERALVGLLCFAAGLAHAQAGAPQLQFAYGGCSAASCQTGWYAGPAVADIDLDGLPDIVWGSYDVVALNATTGALVWSVTTGARSR